MRDLKDTKRLVVLTVSGKVAAVAQDAEAYQRLVELSATANAAEGIRQGLADFGSGRTREAQEIFDENPCLKRHMTSRSAPQETFIYKTIAMQG